MKDGTLRQASKVLSLFEETPGDQIQALLESGLLADLRDGNIAEVKRDDFRRLLGLNPLSSPLLEFVGMVTIPAITERFLACEKFVSDTSRNAKVKIAWFSDNFREWFLDEEIEEPTAKTTLRYAKLTRPELDGSIMDELGDTKETTLAQIYALMKRQKNGGSGVLLTNGGYANIFYVCDVDGGLRAVCVYWDAFGCGWGVNANSVMGPFRWDDGSRVFSRNSSVAVAV